MAIRVQASSVEAVQKATVLFMEVCLSHGFSLVGAWPGEGEPAAAAGAGGCSAGGQLPERGVPPERCQGCTHRVSPEDGRPAGEVSSHTWLRQLALPSSLPHFCHAMFDERCVLFR